MSKKTAKQRWKKKVSWARLMFALHGSDGPFKIPNELERLWRSPGDPLKHRSPGIYLLMQKRKRDTIARGLPWFGFHKGPPVYNCHCVVVKIEGVELEVIDETTSVNFNRKEKGEWLI